jgi:hypothetical protein
LPQGGEAFFDPFRRIGVTDLQESEEVEVGQVFGQSLERRSERPGFHLRDFHVEIRDDLVQRFRFRTGAVVEQHHEIGRTRLRAERSERLADARQFREKRHNHGDARIRERNLRRHTVIFRLRHGLPFVTDQAVEFHPH